MIFLRHTDIAILVDESGIAYIKKKYSELFFKFYYIFLNLFLLSSILRISVGKATL